MGVIIGIDCGTTGNRVIAFSKSGTVIASSYYEFQQIFPRPGWVEHDPIEIFNTTLKALKEVVEKVGSKEILGIGLTNQRETTVLWDKKTGNPISNAIVWQCRRTTQICQELAANKELIKQKTGLPLDPYFSATKIKWLLDHNQHAKIALHNQRLLFGTIDTWILWKLTGHQVHATDFSNASRTLLFNIRTLDYDDELLELFNIPRHILPEVKDSGGLFGVTKKTYLNQEIPILSILGDQQASLFAHQNGKETIIKNTYGTGLFVVTHTGQTIPASETLINTIAWSYFGKTSYAIEGSVFVGGAAIQWLRDGLKVIKQADETAGLASQLASNEGLYFVPALTGLGAPYWDPEARGMIIGITRGTTTHHLARAALESLAYQTRDVVEDMIPYIESSTHPVLRVDGGATQNRFLMQFQSDILSMILQRPSFTETTCLGTAGMSGIVANFWSVEQFEKIVGESKTIFTPKMSNNIADLYYKQWKNAVKRSLKWETEKLKQLS